MLKLDVQVSEGVLSHYVTLMTSLSFYCYSANCFSAKIICRDNLDNVLWLQWPEGVYHHSKSKWTQLPKVLIKMVDNKNSLCSQSNEKTKIINFSSY
jgi:hypothetical protein